MKLVLLLWLSWLVPAGSKVTVWAVKTHAVTFTISNWGRPLDGSLSDMTADIRFDPEQPGSSTFDASLGIASIKSGMVPRDYHLQGHEYFDGERFPRLKMRSRSIRKLDATHFTGVFALTIRDVTRDVEMPFTCVRAGQQATFDGRFSVNRLDFGVGQKSLFLGETVAVALHLVTDAQE
ncbi:MAG: YceI family protein [Bacteroidetes bacterium]|nr:YceI family protein [Fibrella sp.]